jgi:prepilin-type processing-associated H-X9-DG protein
MENSTTPILSDFEDNWHTTGAHSLYVDGHVK